MNKTHEHELAGSIHDLTRRLNDAVWTARELYGITSAFEVSEDGKGRTILHVEIIRVRPATTRHGLQESSYEKEEVAP